jgi:hypothetical protein
MYTGLVTYPVLHDLPVDGKENFVNLRDACVSRPELGCPNHGFHCAVVVCCSCRWGPAEDNVLECMRFQEEALGPAVATVYSFVPPLHNPATVNLLVVMQGYLTSA